MAACTIELSQALTQTGLFKPYLHTDFNQMRNLNDQSGKFTAPDPNEVDGAIDSLAKVLVKYQMHDLLGITLVHNHFSLAEGEIVATQIDPESKIKIRSCMNDELKCKEQSLVFSLEVKKMNAVSNSEPKIPYMWALDPNSNAFFTMQFFDNSNMKLAERFETLTRRENLSSFVKEYIIELKKHHMEQDLGLFLIYQDLIPIDLDTEILYEITDNDTRQQVMFITTKEQVDALKKKYGSKRMVNTHWTVHHDAVSATMWCCVTTCCTSH